MDTATLQALGITPAELIDRIVAKATEELLSNEAYDEEGDPVGRGATDLARRIEKNVQAHVDAKIQALADEHVLPNVSTYIEGLTLQETNRWGERTGEKLTFIEYLVQRADAYMREEVNYEGKAKSEANGYSWSKSTTRVAFMVNKHLHYSIEKAMTQALSHANSSIAKGLEEAVKVALTNATAGLKVAVENKVR